MSSKKVFMIERSPDVFQGVATCLQEEDIDFASFPTPEEAAGSKEPSALIVLFGGNDISVIRNDLETIKTHPAFARLPKVLVLPFNSEVSQAGLRQLDLQEIFYTPVEKLKFKTVLSSYLHRSPRRVFRILVSITEDGSKVRYSGLSMDFSDSGMAFESTADFPVRKDLMISFVNPRNRQRISLKSEVVRKTASPLGDKAFYGVMFKQMSGKDTLELKGFISGSSVA